MVDVYDFYAHKQTSERSERVSLAIFHNKCIITIVQAKYIYIYIKMKMF